MSQLVELQLLNGVVQGMIYALVAAGLTLIFGMLAIPNFAHGIFFAIGAYVAFTIIGHGGNFWVAMIAVPIVVVLLGIAVDSFAIRRLAREGHVYQILFLVGFVLVVQELISLIFGANPISVDVPAGLDGGFPLGNISFPYYRVFLVAISAVLIVAVWLALEKTKYGAIIRAGIDDSAMVECIGINMRLIFTLVFGIGVALAALAGALTLPIRGGLPTMGDELMATSFAVVVIGGLGSYMGATVSGLLIGITQAAATIIYPAAADASVFVAMIVVIMIRPQGLFGQPVKGFALLVAIVAVVPLVLHYPTLETEILTFGLLTVAFNVLLGEMGFFSLGQATFYGVGGYVLAGALFGHFPLLLALLAAALAGALVSAFVGFLAIQRHGVYGVMLTFAFNEMAYYIALQWRDVTGGDNGLRGVPAPNLFGFSLEDPLVFFYFTAVIVLAAFYGVLRMEASPFGTVLRAIRENEARAASIGYRVRWFKITAFAITGALCGLAGGLQAELFRFVPLESIAIQTSTSVVAATLLGGLGSPYGPLIGAAIYITLSDTFSHVWSHWPLLFGLLFCAVVLFFRSGVWGILTQWRRRAAHA